MVLVGARGMGKTVTLGLVADQAVEDEFVAVSVGFDRSSNNAQRLTAAIARAILPLRPPAARWKSWREVASQLQVEVNAGVVKLSGRLPAADADGGQGQRDALTQVLSEAAELARAKGRSGLAVHIDEMQEASSEDLTVVANALQDALRHPAPLVAFAAGLPNTAAKVMEAATFTERFDYRPLHPLTEVEAAEALTRPALTLGVRWEPGAVDAVVEAAGGSPYLLQRMGDEVWQLATPASGESLGLATAQRGLREVAESLATGMFPGRYDRASAREQELLAAMAQVVDRDGVATTRDITRVLGRTAQQISRTRAALIDKGLIAPAARGELTFTMPGFDAYVRARADIVHELETGQGRSRIEQEDQG